MTCRNQLKQKTEELHFFLSGSQILIFCRVTVQKTVLPHCNVFENLWLFTLSIALNV